MGGPTGGRSEEWPQHWLLLLHTETTKKAEALAQEATVVLILRVHAGTDGREARGEQGEGVGFGDADRTGQDQLTRWEVE